MIKRIILGLVALAFATIAHASGTLPSFSLTPQFDSFGKVMPGCKLYVIQAGATSTPQNAYQDSALLTAFSNPLTCDASGRLPLFFLADGLVKVRLTNSAGTQQFVGDNLPVIVTNTGGGGGGGTIDPTTIASTGDIKAVYTDALLAGWVRMNGNTIGSAASGATERANSDCQNLFIFLWNAGGAVPGGRGPSALADWNGGKQIVLPDLRGRTIAGMDSMGGTDAGRLSGSLLTSCRFSVGCAGGEGTHTLTIAEMPSHNHAITDPGHVHVQNNLTMYNVAGVGQGGGGGVSVNTAGANTQSNTTGISVNSNGGGGPHNLMQPTLLATWFMKL
jgi:microcystin-dependent protein